MKCQYADTPARRIKVPFVKAGLVLVAVAVVSVLCMSYAVDQSDASTAWVSGDCSVTLSDDGTLAVTAVDGTGGAMSDYASSAEVPWASAMPSVQKIMVSDGVTHLGSFAFAGIDNLRSVTLPSSVGVPDSTVFDGLVFETPRGIKVTLDGMAGHSFSGFGDKILYQTSGITGDCNWSYDITTKTLTISGDGKMADYSIVSHTPWGEDVASVVINEGVTSIGNAAFEYCSSISSIDIPRSVTSIGQSAFLDCHALSGVGGCAGLLSIGDAAFASCTSIRNIDLPDSVASMGTDAFAGCTMLTEFTLPASMTALEEETFYGCTGLTFITISDGLTVIGPRAFCDCSSMVLFEIPSTVTAIGLAAFKNCTSLQSIELPASVVTIGEAAFNGCSALRSLTFAEEGELKIIDACAFESCTALSTVKVSASVTDIGRGAFAYCESLTDVTIPSDVESIDGLAFAGLTLMLLNGEEIDVNAENLAGCSLSGFGNKVLYRTSGVTGGCFWAYDLFTRVLTVSGSGTMADYSNASLAPWGTDVSSLTIGNEVTGIGARAFMGCKDIWKISIPSSVTIIGDRAFSGCVSMSYLDIPSSVTSIGEFAFGDLIFKVDGSDVDADAVDLAGHVFRIGSDGAMECGSHCHTSDDGSDYVLVLCIVLVIVVIICATLIFIKRR